MCVQGESVFRLRLYFYETSKEDDIEKTRDVALGNGLDLKQIYEDQDPDFFIKQGVKVGVARRFVRDIRDWVNQL